MDVERTTNQTMSAECVLRELGTRGKCYTKKILEGKALGKWKTILWAQNDA